MSKNLQELVSAVESTLAEAGREEARVKAEWLVAGALGIGRMEVLVRGGDEAPASARERLDGWVRRAAAGEPLQYILGETDFMGCPFHCDPRALIPRPETEELVERVLADARIRDQAAPRLADVGTGTGCIAVTLALERPSAHVTAVDCSPDALALARANARRWSVEDRIVWRQADLLDGFAPGALHAVVSNPPYIAEPVWAGLETEVRDHEPRLALVGGGDGLAVIRRLIAQSVVALAPGGMLWMEIGNEQGPAVRRLLEDHGFVSVAAHRDIAGHERMVEAQKPA
jgi:release factor glutamine methyltransferase